MRSLATWALVASLTVIALAAAVDALLARGGAAGAPPARVEAPTPRLSCPKAVAAMFRGEGGALPCVPVRQPRRAV